MSDQEIFELLWENGQLLMRDLPKRAQKSSSCNAHRFSHSSHAHVENGGDTFPPKRPWFGFGTSDSVLLGDYHHDKKNFYLNSTADNSLQDDGLHEPLPQLYQSHFNVFLGQNRGDKVLKDSQVVPTDEYANLKTRCVSNYLAETPQATTSQADHSSLQQQYQELVTFGRASVNSSQNLVSMGVLPNSRLQEQDLDKPVNFSLFLRSPAILKINSQINGVKMPTSSPGLSRAEELKNNGKMSSPDSHNPLESMPIALDNGSDRVEGFRYQPNSVEANLELLPPSAKHPYKPPPDDQSEAVRRKDAFTNNRSPNQVDGQSSNLPANTGKGKLSTEKTIEPPVTSSSLCSRGASNNPTYTLKGSYEDNEGSAHPSEDVEEEPRRATKAVPARASTGNRKRRTEGRRRDKLNKKMRALRELIPNCNKVDKASMLDEAIEYLKTLQLQVQMMSMGIRGGFMPPMILYSGMQQIHVPQLTHLSPMGVEMGRRMHMGFGCSPAQFLISPIPGAIAVPGIPDTRIQMPGFLGQLLPMSMLPAQLDLLHKTNRVAGVSPASAPTELMRSITASNSKDSIQKINSEERNKTDVECSKSQPFV